MKDGGFSGTTGRISESVWRTVLKECEGDSGWEESVRSFVDAEDDAATRLYGILRICILPFQGILDSSEEEERGNEYVFYVARTCAIDGLRSVEPWLLHLRP